MLKFLSQQLRRKEFWLLLLATTGLFFCWALRAKARQSLFTAAKSVI